MIETSAGLYFIFYSLDINIESALSCSMFSGIWHTALLLLTSIGRFSIFQLFPASSVPDHMHPGFCDHSWGQCHPPQTVCVKLVEEEEHGWSLWRALNLDIRIYSFVTIVLIVELFLYLLSALLMKVISDL